MRRARLVALPLAWVLGATTLLGACATQSPEVRLQGRLDAITNAANAQDADGVRNAVELFLDEVSVQSREGMASSRVKRLRDLAGAVLTGADLIDKRITDAQATASAAAKASQAAAAATASASRSAAASASASRSAAASAAASASAAAASPTPSPTEDGIIPTGGAFGKPSRSPK